jgi:DNA-directed RNA polymerase specialized sigma24 family protein
MNEQRLQNLRALKAEIKVRTKEIENWPQGIVTDYYYDYINAQKRVKPLIGLADCDHLKKRLQAKIEALEAEILAVENYLDSIEDKEMATILYMRYSRGMKQEDIGKELGYERSAIAKKITEFWREKE